MMDTYADVLQRRAMKQGYIGNVLSPKLTELLSIAFDASVTHMYAPGTRRHIKAALKQGATIEEIMEVLQDLRRRGCAAVQSRSADACR